MVEGDGVSLSDGMPLNEALDDTSSLAQIVLDDASVIDVGMMSDANNVSSASDMGGPDG